MALTMQFQDFEARFTADLLGEMLQAMEGTRRDGKERGFDFCASRADLTGMGARARATPGAKLTRGRPCTGAVCQVQISNCSGEDPAKTAIGSFHTHPKASARPSPGDLLSTALRTNEAGEYRLDCRLGEKDGVLRCDTFAPALDQDEFDLYVYLYTMLVAPYYDAWAAQGSQPPMPSTTAAAYDLLEKDLLRRSTTAAVEMEPNLLTGTRTVTGKPPPAIGQCQMLARAAALAQQFTGTYLRDAKDPPPGWDRRRACMTVNRFHRVTEKYTKAARALARSGEPACNTIEEHTSVTHALALQTRQAVCGDALQET